MSAHHVPLAAGWLASPWLTDECDKLAVPMRSDWCAPPRLASPFYKLPLAFDCGRMLDEIRQVTPHMWRPDRLNIKGYGSLCLVSHQGKDNDIQHGPFRPSPLLEKCPYLGQVIGSFQ